MNTTAEVQYPKDFIKQLRTLYPNIESLVHMANTGQHTALGRHLWDLSDQVFDHEQILKAESLDELKAKAHIIKQKKELFEQWDTIVKYSKNGKS